MPRQVISDAAMRLMHARSGVHFEADRNKPGVQRLTKPADPNFLLEIPKFLEGTTMLEYMGLRADTAREIWNTFRSRNRQDERDLFLHAKNVLLAAYQTQHHQFDARVILERIGFTAGDNQDMWDLAALVLGDDQFALNAVSKENIRDWAILSLESHFLSMKLLNEQTLRTGNDNLMPPPPPFFPLSLKADSLPGQIVPGTRTQAPDGFQLENYTAVPCWTEPPPLAPPAPVMIPHVAPGALFATGEPDGYFEENGVIHPYWNYLQI